MTARPLSSVLPSRRVWLASAAALAAATAAPHALAQAAYPARPIRIVVGYAAGGAVDAVARAIGQVLSQSLGQPVIVDNKPGAGSNIAVKSVIAAEADGYTLMMAANALAANMSLYQPMPFDAEKDLVAISLVGRVPVVLAAGANAGIGFEAAVWYGLVAPAATPKAVVARLHDEVQKALQTKEVRERMTAVGGEVLPGSSDQFAQLIRSERRRYEKLVREANIKPD
eukprot:gene15723-15540_t